MKILGIFPSYVTLCVYYALGYNGSRNLGYSFFEYRCSEVLSVVGAVRGR